MTSKPSPPKSGGHHSAIAPEAREWTEGLERFKASVNLMYGICQQTKTIAGCKEAMLYLRKASHDFECLIELIEMESKYSNQPDNKQQPVSWEVKATSDPVRPLHMTPDCAETEGSWLVVQNRRRKNTNSSEEDSGSDSIEKEAKKTSVYERLAYNLPRPVTSSPTELILSDANTSTNLMCPRSAMDLPQTKASMAKMAYSRERLWNNRVKPLLEERLQRRQASNSSGTKRPTYSQVAKSNASEKSGSEKRSREPSLASISETQEEEDDKLSTVTMAEADRPSSAQGRVPRDDKNKRKTPAAVASSVHSVSTEAILIGLQDDVEWRSMTAEEESLAHEEESLQKEIFEEEMSSIDEQFEIEANRQFGRTPTRYKKSWKEIVENWSPIETAQQNGHVVYRKPGEVVQVHEKLSSPSRKRRDSNSEKKIEEKQQKAYELRQKLLEEKAQRLKELHQKVVEVKMRRGDIQKKKEDMLSEKMSKACENREMHLAEVVKKARGDEVRIQEIQLMTSLEKLNLKCDIASKDQKAKQKIQDLAEQQERRKQKQAAKMAQAEDNRMVQHQKQQEKLQEQTEKNEARIQNAVVQRNELLEETRQKQRKTTIKIDKIKEEETKMTEMLKEKLSNKLSKAEKMYVEGLEAIKSKAGESVSPKCPSASQMLDQWMGDIDGEYQPVKCLACRVKIVSCQHVISHICSTAHLVNRKCIDKIFTYDLVRMETDFMNVPLKDKEELGDIVDSTDFPPFDVAAVKKRRSKLKQKLVKDNVELVLVPDVLEKAVHKVVKELDLLMNNVIKAAPQALNDSGKTQLEKHIDLLDRHLHPEGGALAVKLSSRLFHTGIVGTCIAFLGLPFFHEKTMPVHLKRIFLKTCALVVLGIATTEAARLAFNSAYLTDFVEISAQVMRSYLQQNNANYEQAVACLSVLNIATSVEDPDDRAVVDRRKERTSNLLSYLASHHLIDVVAQIFVELDASAIPERINLSVHTVVATSKQVCGLAINFARNLPDGSEPKEELLSLFIRCVQFCVKILQDAHVADVLHSEELRSKNKELLVSHAYKSLFAALSLCLLSLRHVNLVKRAIMSRDGIYGMRLVLVLIGVLKRQVYALVDSDRASQEVAVRICGYLAYIDPSLKRMAMIGWQASLLCLTGMHLNINSTALHKIRVLTSLVCLVKTDPVALDMVQQNLSVSWLLLFLKRLKSEEYADLEETKVLLPSDLRAQCLQFYKKKWLSESP